MTERLRCENVELRKPIGVKAFLVFLVGSITAILFGQMFGGGAVFPVLLFTVLGYVLLVRTAHQQYGAASLWLEDGGLRVDSRDVELSVPFADIEDGYELPPTRESAKAAAVVRLKGGNALEMQTFGHDEAARILTHARVAVDQRVLRMPLRRSLGAFTLGLSTFLATMFGTSFVLAMLGPRIGPAGYWYPIVLVAASFATTALFLTRFGYPRVVIGADGVRTEGVLSPRFVAYEDIERVTLLVTSFAKNPVSVRLDLRGGRRVDLPLIALGDEHARAIVQRIEDARARKGTSSLAALARGDRDVASWREALARIAVAEAGFRERALGREDFERVLADASAPADQRVGAAIALRVADPEGASTRVRVAADATADEDLRAALLAAADDQADDAALERVTRPRRPDG